jgi:hypothetical protein
VPTEVQNLIQKMSSANPRWGAPRLHGELLKLGIRLAQATVAKYMVRHASHPRKPGGPSWKIMSRNWFRQTSLSFPRRRSVFSSFFWFCLMIAADSFTLA